VLICGNGGSAADSEHVVGELMKGYRSLRPVPGAVRQRLVSASPEHGHYLADHLQGALPTISLVSQTSLITAFANDVAPDMIFAQQVYGYGREGDVVIGISTSGNSSNVVNAIEVGRALGLHTIGFTGHGGGRMKSLCDATVCVPFQNTADVQERHLPIYHVLCEMLEDAFFS
jgi:D-sedoheptulose 7-phosphate isomerase